MSFKIKLDSICMSWEVECIFLFLSHEAYQTPLLDQAALRKKNDISFSKGNTKSPKNEFIGIF